MSEKHREYYESQSKTGQEDYAKAMDRIYTVDAILSLDKRLTREYLNTLPLDGLHDLEDSLLDRQYDNT